MRHHAERRYDRDPDETGEERPPEHGISPGKKSRVDGTYGEPGTDELPAPAKPKKPGRKAPARKRKGGATARGPAGGGQPSAMDVLRSALPGLDDDPAAPINVPRKSIAPGKFAAGPQGGGGNKKRRTPKRPAPKPLAAPTKPPTDPKKALIAAATKGGDKQMDEAVGSLNQLMDSMAGMTADVLMSNADAEQQTKPAASPLDRAGLGMRCDLVARW